MPIDGETRGVWGVRHREMRVHLEVLHWPADSYRPGRRTGELCRGNKSSNRGEVERRQIGRDGHTAWTEARETDIAVSHDVGIGIAFPVFEVRVGGHAGRRR